MNPSEARNYAQGIESLNVGDKVLIHGSNSIHGNYVIMCEVASIAGDDASLRELDALCQYGSLMPSPALFICPVSYFSESVVKRMEELNALQQKFIEQLRSKS